MRRYIWAFPLLIFLGIAVMLWIGLHHDPRLIPTPLQNKPAPAFHISSLQQPQQMLTEAIFQHQTTILNVFATWCIACQAEHSVWMEVRHELPEVNIVGLDYKDDRNKALRWLKEYGNPYGQILDDLEGKVGINYGVYGTPETFIIDKQGVIRYKFIGIVSPADWRNVLLPEVKKWL